MIRYLFLVGIDDLNGLVENGRHVDQLVSDLFARHDLQGGPLGLVLALALAQVHTEVDALFAVIDADLHVVVADAVHQQTLQVERRREPGQFQQPGELDRLVDLRYLPHETDERHVLQGRDVLLQGRVLFRLERDDDLVDAGAEQEWVELHLEPIVEVLQLRACQVDYIDSNL